MSGYLNYQPSSSQSTQPIWMMEYRLCTELWTRAAATSSIWKLELSTAERVPVYSEPRLAEEFSTYECTPAHLLPERSRLMMQTEGASYRRSNRTYKSIWDWSHFPSPDPPRKLSSALDIFSPSSSIVSHTFHIPYRAFRQTILRLYHIFIVIHQARSEDGQVPNRRQSRCLSVRAAEFTLQHPDNLTGATGPRPFSKSSNTTMPFWVLRTTVPRSSQSP